tara:strand:- start:237 stop:449 length:213 start_codon:yes stop_codon:yes gene_type:complete
VYPSTNTDWKNNIHVVHTFGAPPNQPSIDLLTIGWIKKSSSALDNIVAAENRLMLVVKSGMVEHGTAKRV